MGVKRQFPTIFQLYCGSWFHLLVEESVVFSLTNLATIEYTTAPEKKKGGGVEFTNLRGNCIGSCKSKYHIFSHVKAPRVE